MFTCGFFDSKDGDRKYNAKQMSAIFDGIIMDGVYSNIGEALMVVKGTGMQVVVQTGRAWFKHVWCLNDSHMPLEISAADVIRTRIDAVVIEINHNLDVRNATIKVVKGNPATTASKPTMVHANDVDQYALAYVTVDPETTEITSDKIEIAVGKNETPFVQCPLRTVSIEDLFNQWETEFDNFMAGRQSEFDEWFANLKLQLTDDVVTNLQNQIDERPTFEYVNNAVEKSNGLGHRTFFKGNGVFKARNNVVNNRYYYIVQGAGGNGVDYFGGCGGMTSIGSMDLEPGVSVDVVVGFPSTKYTDRKSSFGTIVANGGHSHHEESDTEVYSGGSGGGARGDSEKYNGGTGGIYGGGGGGGGVFYLPSSTDPDLIFQGYGNGGAGGCGGGGAVGPGTNVGKSTGTVPGTGQGGAGGSNGISTGEMPEYIKKIIQLVPELGIGSDHFASTSRCGMTMYSSIGYGGGGGIYADGGVSMCRSYRSDNSFYYAGTGGGGGFFGKGGDGYYAGGGGGGFNGKGGDSSRFKTCGGGGGGLDIGDGTKGKDGSSIDSNRTIMMGGEGGYGYGGGGGGNYDYPNARVALGAPGIVIIAWETEYTPN